MKRNTFATLFGFAFIGLTLAACNPNSHKPPKGTPDLDVSSRVVDYATGEGSDNFMTSSGYGNGDVFNVTWNSTNAVVEDEELHLSITEATSGDYPYFGGEVRSLKFYGYGDYGVKMKPGKTVGTASTFFLYTGEWDSEELHPSSGATDTKNPDNPEGKHDEIDIEFLGKNTRKVQFNYFTNGRGGNEYMYDLGFDASEEWHTYGFRWEEGRITWFVDEKPVYTATRNIPTHPGRIISNYWCGNSRAAAWMGTFKNENVQDAKYAWMSSSAEGNETHKEDDLPPSGDEVDWSTKEVVPFSDVQGNTDTYTYQLRNDNKEMEVTYSNVGQTWHNLHVAVPSSVSDARILAFEVQNLGSGTVAVRGNANDVNSAGDVNTVNASAKQDGVGVYTDLEWGGSFFSIAPNQTSLCEITYSETINRLAFMIDSHIEGLQSGHIIIKNLKFAEGGSQPEGDAVSLYFSGDGYVCSTQDGVTTITYDSIDDNSYKNVVASLSGKVPAGSNTLSMRFTNNGAESVQINVDIRVGETSYFVLRDDVQYDWYNEAEHRAQYNISAGATRDLVFAFDGSITPEILLMFINSSWAETTSTHTDGNMTISNIIFSTVE